jgi:hypothetical protein
LDNLMHSCIRHDGQWLQRVNIGVLPAAVVVLTERTNFGNLASRAVDPNGAQVFLTFADAGQQTARKHLAMG